MTWSRSCWSSPARPDRTCRRLCLLPCFGGIGTHSGFASWQALHDPAMFGLPGAGTIVTAVTSLSIMLTGRFFLRIPGGTLAGVIAYIPTQPAALSAALEQRLDETPTVGCAAVFPMATVVKLMPAQALTRR